MLNTTAVAFEHLPFKEHSFEGLSPPNLLPEGPKGFGFLTKSW